MDLKKLYQELYDSMYGQNNTCERFTTNLTEDPFEMKKNNSNTCVETMNAIAEDPPMETNDAIMSNESIIVHDDTIASSEIEPQGITTDNNSFIINNAVAAKSVGTDPLDVNGTVSRNTELFFIDGVTVTSSDTEPYIIDGVTVTSSDTEPFIIDGVTTTESNDSDVMDMNFLKPKTTSLNFQMMGLYDESYASDLYESDEYE